VTLEVVFGVAWGGTEDTRHYGGEAGEVLISPSAIRHRGAR
jgi:hypothetical protein